MTYHEAVEYISKLEKFGSDYGLERMEHLLEVLGHPDCSYPIIHVAGTNGKGSTCAFISNILMSSGYVVGSYFSPSVFSYKDRFQINMQHAPESEIAKAFTKVVNVSKQHNINATAFEIETAVALIIFKNMKVDFVVLETGLGGRWDATNAISQKLIAVITNISLDHQQILGNTIQEIASEKAAISRGKIHTTYLNKIVEPQLVKVKVFNNGKENEIESEVIYTAQPKLISHAPLNEQKFEYDGKEYKIQLIGTYQINNASLAILVAEELKNCGYKITYDSICDGLYNTKWGARFQVVRAGNQYGIKMQHDQILILDGSHNAEGAQSLKASVCKNFKDAKVGFVLGVLADKAYEEIVKELSEVADFFICVQSNSTRALEKEELAKICKQYNKDVECADSVKKGVEKALSREKNVILCGSLTLFEELTNG